MCSKKKSAIALLLVGAVLVATAALADSPPPTPKPPDPQEVIGFLRQTVDWYRNFSLQPQWATDPADARFLSDSRQLSEQVVRLAFEFARGEADLIMHGPATANASALQEESSIQTRYQALLNAANRADRQVKASRDEIEALRRKLETVPASKRRTVESAIAENQSELELAETRRDVIRSMIEFISGTGGKGGSAGGLRSQLEELQRAVPPDLTKPVSNGQSAAALASTANTAPAPTAKPEPSGILALIGEVRAQSSKLHALDEWIRQTEALADASKNLRSPQATELKRLIAEGDTLANEPDSNDPRALAQQKQALDSVTARFKQLAAVVIPLGKQGILLDLHKSTLLNWRQAVHNQYLAKLRSLILRLTLLALVVGVLVGAAEVWRRAILRYVQDTRRRHQMMVLRRIVLWISIAIIVAFSFATELGSLATFAGLLTAGVALALQNVISSIAGYFFLIGKHGVRIGDRVQISGVTGEVVDVGLVRLHLMELGSGAMDAQPTGRVVVFSNSVVFQPGGGFFKQIPGTNFVWHEIKLTLAAESNYRSVEQRLVGAVEKIFAEHRDEMQRQQRHMQSALSTIAVSSLGPQSRLSLTQNGLDVVIRYPVQLEKAAEVDDRITREVLDAIEQEPKLKLVGTGTPNIRPVQEPAKAAGAD